jgi:hypothetical protein
MLSFHKPAIASATGLLPILLVACGAASNPAEPGRASLPPPEPAAVMPSLVPDASIPEEAATTTPSTSAPAPEAGELEPVVHLPEPTFDGLKKADRIAAIKDAADEALKIISSPDFRKRLTAMNDLHAGTADTTPVKGTDVATIYLGLDGAAHQYPTSYVMKMIGPVVAPCGATADTVTNDTTHVATARLRACTLDRAKRSAARKDDVAQFACAVNTIAHEWTHAIPADPGVAVRQRYTDDKHDPSSDEKLVSYTLGALAQCLYLDTHDFPVRDVNDCIRQIGTSGFNSSTCKDAWARSLK